VALALLATPQDLEERLGRCLDETDYPRVMALLRDASAKVRRVAGQDISLETTTARVVVRCGKARLPQYPVTAVVGVTDASDDDVDAVFDGLWTLAVSACEGAVLSVEFTHGYESGDSALDGAVAIVCQMAGRALGRTPEEGAITSETVGPFSVSIGSAGAAGAVGMLKDERDVALGYRHPGLGAPISVISGGRAPWTESWV
jgi:hypothetical protein